MKRRISAIMCADVVGYSRLVAEDEEEALRRLLSYRSVFDGFIRQADGRIFNTAGDAVLAEFPSAVDAVRAAIDIQESLRTRNLAYPNSRKMHFRIGITIGDVVEQDGDLLGDAVNIAARLQTLAQPGGICLSQTVREQVANKLSASFRDLGSQSVKNIPQEIRAFTVEFGLAPDEVAPVAAPAPATPRGGRAGWAVAAVAIIALLAGGAFGYQRGLFDLPTAEAPQQQASAPAAVPAAVPEAAPAAPAAATPEPATPEAAPEPEPAAREAPAGATSVDPAPADPEPEDPTSAEGAPVDDDGETEPEAVATDTAPLEAEPDTQTAQDRATQDRATQDRATQDRATQDRAAQDRATQEGDAPRDPDRDTAAETDADPAPAAGTAAEAAAPAPVARETPPPADGPADRLAAAPPASPEAAAAPPAAVAGAVPDTDGRADPEPAPEAADPVSGEPASVEPAGAEPVPAQPAATESSDPDRVASLPGIPIPVARPERTAEEIARARTSMRGRPFRIAEIPFVCDSCRRKIDAQYTAAKTSKALAINLQGDSGWSWGWSSEKRAIQEALESCQNENRRSCELYAIDGRVVWDHPAPVMPPLPWVDETVAAEPFAVDKVPFVSEKTRETLTAKYLNAAGPKAVAVAPDGSWSYFTKGDSVDEVMRRALESCSFHAGQACRIVALNDTMTIEAGPVNASAVD